MFERKFTPPNASKWEAHSYLPDDTQVEVENTGTDEIGDAERAAAEEE